MLSDGKDILSIFVLIIQLANSRKVEEARYIPQDFSLDPPVRQRAELILEQSRSSSTLIVEFHKRWSACA